MIPLAVSTPTIAGITLVSGPCRSGKSEWAEKLLKDFPDVKYISLEQNYRSTKNILEAANQVISSNSQRMPKKLWSQGDDGEKINWLLGENEVDEVELVVRQIRKKIIKNGRKFYSRAPYFYPTV